MSGGHFDYTQFHLWSAAEDIRERADSNPPEVATAFREGARLLVLAATYMHRIDWLLSGDDGEKSFLRRLAEDLAEINPKGEAEAVEPGEVSQ